MSTRKRSPLQLLALAVVATVSLLANVASADIIPCNSDYYPAFDDVVCAEADVGKPCQGGGQCVATSCGASQIYRCETCPAILEGANSPCGFTQANGVGEGCGDGGVCALVPIWCGPTPTESRYSCVGKAPAQPTGPPRPESDASNAGNASPASDAGAGDGEMPGVGCTMAAVGTRHHSLLTLVMVVGGALTLLIDRHRRARRQARRQMG